MEIGYMDNFTKYFIKPRSRGFKKNLAIWKDECKDSENYNNIDEAKNIYLFYHVNEGICQHPECNKETKFISLGRGFKDTCSRVHSMELTSLNKYGVKYKSQLPEFQDAVKKTNLEKYGSENVFASDEIKDKIKKTNLEKYGCENPQQNKEIRSKTEKTMITNNGGLGFQTGKAKETMKQKYGVSNPSQVREFQDKKRKTFIENYGVDNPMKSRLIQEKAKKTNLERYGVENVFSSEEIKGKIEKTNLEKYGCENPNQNDDIKAKIRFSRSHLDLDDIAKKTKQTNQMKFKVDYPMQNEDIRKKSMKTLNERYGVSHNMHVTEFFEKSQKNMYKKKEYIWKTGEISILQGYEPLVLKDLEESGYTFDQIKTKYEDMPEIFYTMNNKQRRYYPDFYIPSENLIIEVKSKYTLENKMEENNLKFKATKDLGFNFKLEVR